MEIWDENVDFKPGSFEHIVRCIREMQAKAVEPDKDGYFVIPYNQSADGEKIAKIMRSAAAAGVRFRLDYLESLKKLQEPTPAFTSKWGKYFTLPKPKSTLVDFLNENPPKHVSSRLPNLTGEKNESTSI